MSSCTEACPLSHDSSVAYEDFLVAPASGNSTVTLTGFQITLTSYYGASAGLHLLQLLSAGSVSYSIDGQNRGYGQGVCSSGPYSVYGRSSSTHTPTEAIPWDHAEVASSTVSGTSEGMLCAATPVDTDPPDAPEATWYPYIAQDGPYEIQYFTPACAFDATCGQRGFIDVTVEITGSEGSSSTLTTINQEVTFDTKTSIFSGPIQPIAQGDQVKVTMKLSSRRKATLAPGKGDKYYLIADKIIVLAQSMDGNGSTQVKIGSGPTAVNVTPVDSSRTLRYTSGHSLWEWSTNSAGAVPPMLDSASTAPQQAQSIDDASALDRLSFALGPSASIASIATSQDGAFTFIAGSFNYSSGRYSAQSVLSIASDAAGIVSIPQGGLNGAVSSVVVQDGWLYAVGAFNGTADGSVTGLNGKARCQYASLAARWEAIPGLSDADQGSVIGAVDQGLLIGYSSRPAERWSAGNETVLTDGQPFIAGNVTAISVTKRAIFVAGQIATLGSAGSNSLGTLTAKGIQANSVTFDVDATAQQASVTASSRMRRRGSDGGATSEIFEGALALLKSRLRKRQSPTVATPTSLPMLAGANVSLPQILAGAYWQNTTSKKQATIIGGSFVLSGQVANLAGLGDDGQIGAVSNEVIVGTISSLAEAQDVLWVGGDFMLAGQPMQLAALDLPSRTWQSSIALAAATGSPAVNALGHMDQKIVVAGHFDSIAGQACSSVCQWDSSTKTWSSFGTGLSGVASSLATTGVSGMLSRGIPQDADTFPATAEPIRCRFIRRKQYVCICAGLGQRYIELEGPRFQHSARTSAVHQRRLCRKHLR